jgi:predicted nucleic acid-binding protein
MSESRIVFDAEALIAHLASETGEEVVEEYLDRVDEGNSVGFISPVTLTEVSYVGKTEETTQPVDIFLMWLQTVVNQVRATDCWRDAARYKGNYQVALGDAFSLATANYVDATLVAGADDDFDDITDVNIVRFRNEPA